MAKRELIDREKAENITWEEPSYTDALNVLTEVRDKIRGLPVIAEQDIVKPVLDKIRAEIYNAIEFERKWLCDAGHTSKDIDIALNAIKSKVKDVLEKGAESEEGK